MSAITEAVKTAMFDLQSNALGLIGDVIPYALTIMGAVLVVSIGIRVFKRVTGR